jgi:hypothetical protein
MISTHLCATAEENPDEALRLLLVSIEIWALEGEASIAPLADFEMNPNNFWSWLNIGTELSAIRKLEEAADHWKKAMCMWPRGGKHYASRMTERAKSRPAWNDKDRAELSFWQSVSNDAIRSWCQEFDIRLPEAALGD